MGSRFHLIPPWIRFLFDFIKKILNIMFTFNLTRATLLPGIREERKRDEKQQKPCECMSHSKGSLCVSYIYPESLLSQCNFLSLCQTAPSRQPGALLNCQQSVLFSLSYMFDLCLSKLCSELCTLWFI